MLRHRLAIDSACYRAIRVSGRLALPDPLKERLMFRPPQLCAVWGRVALAATLLVAAPGIARAQFERASVSGVVTDQSGGVVPGVTVTALRTQTQQPTTAVTDASGYYTLPSLMPGLYDISVELDGFKKTTRSAVQLDAAASVTLAFNLEPGALTETV